MDQSAALGQWGVGPEIDPDDLPAVERDILSEWLADYAERRKEAHERAVKDAKK